MSYKVLSDYQIRDLEDKVTHYMKNGYLPTGGITIREIFGKDYFHQAVYKPLQLNVVQVSVK